MVRSDLCPFAPDIDETNQHMTTLTESGRWVEVAVPLGSGDAHLLVASFYGISGASSEPAAKVENARLAAAAFIRKAHFKDVPYFLGTDLNENPDDNMVARSLTTAPAPHSYDIFRDWLMDKDGCTPATYHCGQVWQGMQGQGATRIDTIFGNRCSSQLVEGAQYLWEEAAGHDHVILSLCMKRDPQGVSYDIGAKPCPIRLPCDKLPPNLRWKSVNSNDDVKLFNDVWSELEQYFDEAVRRE